MRIKKYFKKIKWALRKAKLPVGRNDLVLDVGSGGTPFPRSDVLLDRITGAEHRCGASMVIDRPAVYGDAQKMPFKDKSFDFVVASHILEHMSEPEKFIKELQRVAKAGYIEVPNAIFERFAPYDIHCLEIMKIKDTLHIHKKMRQIEDNFLGKLRIFNDDHKWKTLFEEDDAMFHSRLYWDSEIKYIIYNPDTSCDWIEEINENSLPGETGDDYLHTESGWRRVGLNILNRWYGFFRAKRLKKFSLLEIICCPECHSDLVQGNNKLICKSCNVKFDNNTLPDFTTFD